MLASTRISLMRKIVVFQVLCVMVAMASVGSITVEVGMHYVWQKTLQQVQSLHRVHLGLLVTGLSDSTAVPVTVAKALQGDEGDTRSFMVDTSGQPVVAGLGHPLAKEAMPILAADQGTRELEYTEANGERMLGFYSPLPLQDRAWVLVTETPYRQSIIPARISLTVANAVVGIAMGLLVVFITMRYARRAIGQPVEELLFALKDLHAGEGDLTRRLRKSTDDEVGQMAEAFNRFLDKLHAVIGEVVVSINRLGGSASAVKQAAEGVSEVATSQAASVEETSAALD